MKNAPPTGEVRLEPMTSAHLDAVLAVEQQTYSHPWTRGNFADSLATGYHCRCLLGARAGGSDALLGYFVALHALDEVHLLNFTLAPPYQRQGWAPLLLQALCGWAQSQQAQWLWLEVRASNQRAQHVYSTYGFCQQGVRKGYYPGSGGREDAIVMRLRLDQAARA